MNRFSVGIYHCNDYHGALAPLYLLPRTIPCALSLHNAEFQGMWPMRTSDESKEVCKVFNLDEDVVKKFCQYGSGACLNQQNPSVVFEKKKCMTDHGRAVFNLLNAGASYLRVYQRGFGAVGVSEKYGDRAFARYPIFWGLPQIGKLPNPDPTDTAAWDKIKFLNDKTIEIDQEYEGSRSEDKRQAQEWAGLEPRPDAELFVFVGRWCMQKGVSNVPVPDYMYVCRGSNIWLTGGALYRWTSSPTSFLPSSSVTPPHNSSALAPSSISTDALPHSS